MKIKKKHRKIIYPFLFFLGLGLMIWQIKIFRNTIIDLFIPLGIILVVGTLAFLFDYKNYKKTYKKKGTGGYFYSAIQSLVGFGFIACSIFMLMNYYFAEEKTEHKIFEILERSSLPGSKYNRDKRKPTFTINFEGKEKQLVFTHKYYEKRNLYKSVEMETRKGYFGFDILENKKLN